MIITLNITEDSRVVLVKDGCEAVQGEHNATTLVLNLPSTIKGYSIDNYKKNIEFKECKDFGECAKFYDVVEGNTYDLCSTCTQYKKIMIQFTLTNTVDEEEPIVWKTIPFALEFTESINAENEKTVQVALLSLAEILDEWEAYIKSNTLRMVYSASEVPEADAKSLGDTIFYLGENITEPYTLEYGYYYRLLLVDDVYTWVNIVKDPNIGDVSNGIREINKNVILQFWQGTQAELDNVVKQPNVFYIPTDQDANAEINEILTNMSYSGLYKLAYPITQEDKQLKYYGKTIPQVKECTVYDPRYDSEINKYIITSIEDEVPFDGDLIEARVTYTSIDEFFTPDRVAIFRGFCTETRSGVNGETLGGISLEFYPIMSNNKIKTLVIENDSVNLRWNVNFYMGTLSEILDRSNYIKDIKIYKITE